MQAAAPCLQRVLTGFGALVLVIGAAAAQRIEYGEPHGDWRVMPHGARAASATQADAIHDARLRYLCTKRREGIHERLELLSPNLASTPSAAEAGQAFDLRFHFASGGEAAVLPMRADARRQRLQSDAPVRPVIERMRQGGRLAVTQQGAPPDAFPISLAGFASAVDAARDLCARAPEVPPDGFGDRGE